MNIAPISERTQFRGVYKNYIVAEDLISKPIKKIKKSEKVITTLEDVKKQFLMSKDVLKSYGITYCNMKDKKLNIACGYNGGFYIIPIDDSFPQELTKEYFAFLAENKPYMLGGLYNYINLVKDFKRQDLIQKGLKIHTFEMNNDVDLQQQSAAAKNLSARSKKWIKPNDLFFIENEAFYYDKLDKSVYCVNLDPKDRIRMNPSFRFCEFKYDKSDNVIGYKVNDWNFYNTAMEDFEYIEQQAPSRELKDITEYDNNKLFAESFRFGNGDITYREEKGVREAINFLEKKLKIKNLKMDDLQIVRYKNKNNDEVTRISYYDPTIGKSFVYDKSGKYMYQLEYVYNPFGEIIACTKI